MLVSAFRSPGPDHWRYNVGGVVSGVRNFELAMKTNFGAIDFSEDALAPTNKRRTGDGWDLTWKYAGLVSGFNVSVEMSHKLQVSYLRIVVNPRFAIREAAGAQFA